jgi:hypothetical protein
MKRTGLTTRYLLATLALGTFIWAAPAGAQSQSTTTPESNSKLDWGQLAAFDQFLDNHPEIAEQLKKDPSLADKQQFVQSHPALQQFLQQHPDLSADLKQDPNAVMHQEDRYIHGQDQIRLSELATMNNFMDSHPEIAQQLQKDPSLIDNKHYVDSHPALQQFLASHPELAQAYEAHPNLFMRDEDRYENHEDRITGSELANMDGFMDSHPEIAQQLEKDPSLVDNKKFVADHPAFQQFLASHPELAQAYEEHPNEFMQDENRYQHHDDSALARNGDMTHGNVSSFHDFLANHSAIANELSKNPSLATNQEYLANHTELQAYLKTNPQVNEQLSQNPQAFLNSTQGVDPLSKGTPKFPASEPKEK